MKRLKATSNRKHTLANGKVKTYKYPRKPVQRKSGLTVAQAISEYRQSPAWTKLADSTKMNNLRYMRVFEETYAQPDERGQEIMLRDLRREHLTKVRDAVVAAAHARNPQDTGHGAGLVYCRAVSKLFSWCVKEGRLPLSPAILLATDLEVGTHPTWTQEELRICLEGLPRHLGRAVQLAHATGLRRSDLCAMTWDQITEQGIECVGDHALIKTGVEIIIPITDEFRAVLARWRHGALHDYVLSNKDGQPMKETSLTSGLSRALKKIGIDRRINTHGIRKMVLTELADDGCSVYEIMAVSGHKAAASVAKYVEARNNFKLAQSGMAKRRK